MCTCKCYGLTRVLQKDKILLQQFFETNSIYIYIYVCMHIIIIFLMVDLDTEVLKQANLI